MQWRIQDSRAKGSLRKNFEIFLEENNTRKTEPTSLSVFGDFHRARSVHPRGQQAAGQGVCNCSPATSTANAGMPRGQLTPLAPMWIRPCIHTICTCEKSLGPCVTHTPGSGETLVWNKDNTILLSPTNNIMTCEKVILRVIPDHACHDRKGL